MGKLVLYPYPRLDRSAVQWGEWSARVDGRRIALGDLADVWDSKSSLTFELLVQVSRKRLTDIGVHDADLLLEVACRDTSYTASTRARLETNNEGGEAAFPLQAIATVSVAGAAITQTLDLRSSLVAPYREAHSPQAPAWLERRVISEAAPQRVVLDSDLAGFPTAAYSFEAEKIPAAPWRIVITADEPEAPFAHSVKLELNEDYPSIRKLIAGNADPAVSTELHASIIRILIGSVAHLTMDSEIKRSPEEIALEHPESIVASARRVASQHLKIPLDEAVKLHRLQPERLEYLIANTTGMLRGRS